MNSSTKRSVLPNQTQFVKTVFLLNEVAGVRVLHVFFPSALIRFEFLAYFIFKSLKSANIKLCIELLLRIVVMSKRKPC